VRVGRWLAAGAIGLGVLLIAVVLGYRQTSLPVHEGRLDVAGLGAPVTIRRDAQGIPAISATSEADALFALGFVHAQDRLWQMEFNRRLAAGRLAEVLGPAALPTDRFLRTLGVHAAAQRIYDAYDAEHRALVDAYVAGVNGFLATRSGPLPPEFLLTGTPTPARWMPADSISWSLMMAWDLAAHGMRMELRRLRLARAFTRDEIEDFYPPLPGVPPATEADFVEIYRLLGALRVSAVEAPFDLALPEAGFGRGDGLGSNNWVLAGSRTVSGKPLLANDPHLGLTVPPVWYFAHLAAPGLAVSGATLPGLPGVVLGRNARLAWGVTNTNVDQQDLYLERRVPDDAEVVDTPDGPRAMARRVERIAVKGQADVELVVRATRHGPVLSGLESIDKAFKHPQYVLALRWSALDGADPTVPALRALWRATSVTDADAALAQWQVVSQTFVLADDAGHIARVVAGRIPLRRADNDLKGAAPAPGWDARYDWQGYLPHAQAPRVVDPPSGVLVSANNRIVAGDFPHHLTSDWFPAYRADRIEQLLAGREKHDMASMRALQADVTSLQARELMALMRTAQPLTTAGRDALQRLQAWDGTMAPTRPEPLLFHAWRRELTRRVFEDDFGDLAEEFVIGAEPTRALARVLRGEARSRDWCDDRRTRDRFESCQTLMSEALDTAVTQLTEASGRDVAGLRWGDAHIAVAEHRPLGNAGHVARLFERRTPFPGDTYTVNVGALSNRAGAPFTTRHTASFRAIYDLGAPEKSLWVHSAGQVGHPLSDLYDSMRPLWRDGDYVPLRPAATGMTLELRPQR
jgi:penicillin amidase